MTRPRTRPGVAEAHLGLGRVHVDVDRLGRAGQEQRRGRVAVAGEQVGVGGAQRAEQQLVAHRAAVDEEVLRHRRAAREGRQRREAAEAQALARRRRSAARSRRSPGRAARAAGRRGASKRSPGSGRAAGARAGRPGRCGRRGVKATPGAAMASRRTTSAIACASARSARRNFSRAGVAENRPSSSTTVPRASAAGPQRPTRRAGAHGDGAPPRRAPAAREVRVSRPTAPSEGSASPRKPKSGCASRSVPSIFEVAWRASASASSSGRDAVAVVCDPDQPLAAVGEGDVDPPRAGVERVLDELLDRRAGRSTTSPAAMRFAAAASSWRIGRRAGSILGLSAFIPQD